MNTRELSGTRTVIITPEKAREWLERGGPNRSVSDTTVRAFASDILAGRWLVTHQGIALDTSGRVLDGQHRLWAIVTANVATPMLVTFGVAEEAMSVIDAGRQRTVGDRFMIAGVSNARLLVARSSAAAWLDGASRVRTAGRLTYGQVEETRRKFGPSLDWSIKTISSNSVRAHVGGALAWCHYYAPRPVEVFTAQVRDGQLLRGDDPAYALRNHLTNTNHEARFDTMEQTVRCAAAAARGERLSRVGGTRNGAMVDECIAWFRSQRR